MFEGKATTLPRIALAAAVFWFAGMPLVYVFYGAVKGGANGGLTAAHLDRVFLSGDYLTPLLNTIALAGLAGAVATLIGAVIAWTMSRTSVPRPDILEIGIMAPIFISPFIGAIGWITLGQPDAGMLNVFLGAVGLPQVNIFSYGGTVVIMALYFAPYAYAMLRHSIDRLNPEMEEAAATSGAGRVRTIVSIVLPLLWPSLLSALIFSFMLSAEMFSIPGILLAPQGFEVLSYRVYVLTTQYPVDYSEAAAAGILLLLLTVIGIAFYGWAVRVQERFIAVGPKAARQQGESSPLVKTVGLAIILVFVLVSVVLPVIAIALRSLLPYFSGSFALADLSLENVRNALADSLVQTALRNSLLVTLMSCLLLLAISFLVALAKVRKRDRISRATAMLAGLPIAVPGVLFGVGLLWQYIGTPVYATIWILVLVMLARFLPILVRMFETALIQIGKELDEAAAVSGASEWTITFRIRLPLLLDTIRSAVAVGGAQVFNELTASALLFTSTSAVLPVVVYSYMFDGDYSRASAVALLQIVLLIVGFGMISLATRRRRQTRPEATYTDPQGSIGLPAGG
jgi:iron(III) transport system permease protein